MTDYSYIGGVNERRGKIGKWEMNISTSKL